MSQTPELIRDHTLVIRPMRDAEFDYSLLSTWLSDPRVLEFYEGRDQPLSPEAAREKYSVRIMAEDHNTPCIVEHNEQAIGYLQFYPADEPDTWGIDQFIGIPEKWNQGLGTRTVKLMLRYLFDSKQATRCTLDPRTTNTRAIRCYEKAGFHKVRLLPRHELHEGDVRDCWLMEALHLSHNQ